ncbi:MAG: type 3 dihydrofolate reductase [Salibacteraceae bacterium]
MIISLIAAISKNHVIGRDGDLPWHLPRDLRFFSDTTRGHHVLMGRKNFDTIPDKYRPLPNRTNLVVTRSNDFHPPGVHVFHSIDDAINHARNRGERELFIIGGGEIYRQCIDLADRLYITHVDAEIEGDTYFPEFDESDWQKELLLSQPVDDVHKFPFKTYLYSRVRSQ